MNSFFNSLRLLAATATLSAAVASAASVPASVPGDLFVGFRASDGDGAQVSYLVKIGQDSVFRNAAPGSAFDLTSLGNLATDLSATFGSSWQSRPDLSWGIFGTRLSVNSSLYASRARLSAAQPATAWPALSQNARNATAQSIIDVLSSIGGYDGSQATANSPVATLQPNSSADSSYFRQVATPGTSDFGSLSQWTSIEGTAASTLDLFRISSTGSTSIGSFSISPSGTIRFTAPPAAGNQDSDNDSFSDAIEAVAGTDPASSSDFPRSLISSAPAGIRIQSATAAPNRTYSIEYATNPGATSWSVIATHQTGASSARVDFTDTDPVRRAQPSGFYRIRFSN